MNDLAFWLGTLQGSLEDPFTWLFIVVVAATAYHYRVAWLPGLLAVGFTAAQVALMISWWRELGLTVEHLAAVTLILKLIWAYATFAVVRTATGLLQRR